MSDLLNQASLVMVPSGYKEDTVYSVVPSDGSGDLSFTRASNGTRINSAGLIEVCPWNLLQYSEDFSNVYWGKTNLSVSANSTTAPNGTTTADTLTTTSTAQCQLITYFDFLVGNYTLSFYVKKVDIGFTYVEFGYAFCWVNLTTGAITGGSQYSTGWTFVSANASSVGDGWFKVEMVASCSIAGSYGVRPLQPVPSSGSYDGQPTNKATYLWGAQVNIGSTAKPYFPTTDRLNVPRLTYQNGGGGCPSLLLEKQSTNVNAKSNDFTIGGGYWYDYNGKTPIANQGTSPDGTNNAWSIPSNSYLTTEFGKTIGLTIGDKTAASIWAKGSETAFRLYIENVTNTDILGSVTVNLNTGAITSGSGTVEAYGNGWYKISTIGTSTITNGYPRAIVSNPNTSCLIYGSQFEASSYATSYIPTTSSSATRVADACYKTGISSLIGQTEGVLFVDVNVNITGTAANYAGILINDGTSSNSILFGYYQGGRIQAAAFVSGSLVVNIDLPSFGLTSGRHKFALAYKLNDYVFYVDGVQVGSDTSASVPATSVLLLSDIIGADIFYNQAVLFKTRLTNAELASLTTI